MSEETRAAKQEVQSILKMIPELDAALRARKQHVYSAEVPSDSVDVALHAVLRAGTMTPPGLVCRLGPGNYMIGKHRVHLQAGPGGTLLCSKDGEKVHPLADLFHEQAQQHASVAQPHQNF